MAYAIAADLTGFGVRRSVFGAVVVAVVAVASAATVVVVVVVGGSRNPRYSFVDVWLAVVVFKGSIIGGEAIVRDGRGG